MNTHPVSNEEVMAYLDGELSHEAAAAMTAHLSQCRACQDVAADLQGVSRQMSGWAAEVSESSNALPAGLVSALEVRAAAKTKPLTSVWNWRFFTQHSWVAIPAVLVVLIPGLILMRAYVREALPTSHTSAPLMHENKQENLALDMATSVAPVELGVPPAAHKAVRALTAVPQMDTPPLIVHNAELHLTARSFDTARADLERILLRYGGHIAQLSAASPTGEARSLNATLRIPSPQLDPTLAELRKLGHVESESQHGEEVTQQSVDLEARLNNARHTEQRLTQILATRTGKLSDVLEVEQKLSQVRGEIEQAEAEQKSLNNRVSFATVVLQISEEYRAPLATAAPSVGTRLSNAAVEGLHTAFDGFIGAIQALLAAGPSLLLWGLVLGLPAYFLWKKLRHR